ncbi:LytTR family transcriptional regulator DNA-binding domain-containing protein [Algoriphagus sp.]|uniref:LytTR family transcriptional regulator DNA-binding domain-containing protein n=1 Tax=Algoriphagus sp. TaxID=1872435 RepID=UPI0034294707
MAGLLTFWLPNHWTKYNTCCQVRSFFWANRQVMVNRHACEYFEPIGNGKLQLIVQPELANRIIISQKRAKGFKEWAES